MNALASLLARLMLATIFLASGGNKIMNPADTIKSMGEVGIPYPNLLYFGAIAFLLLGSIAVVLGWFTRIGSLLLMIFLAMATYYFHAVWNDPSQMIAFMKNTAIFGGLLFLFANGPGGLSLDGRRVVRQEVVVEAAKPSK